MKVKERKVNRGVAVGIAVAGLTLAAQGLSKSDLPRGPDIQPLAGSCNIGPFPQTSKAGQYNQLCNVMQDAEKCLAFLKRHFHHNGEVEAVYESDVAKANYCLDVLKRDLGLDMDTDTDGEG